MITVKDLSAVGKGIQAVTKIPLTRAIAVLMIKAIAENKNTLMLMGLAVGLIDLQLFFQNP